MDEVLWPMDSFHSDQLDTVLSQYSSLADMLTHRCQRFAKKTAYEHLGARLDYHTLAQKADLLARYFQQVWGLKKGDRIALMMPNCLQYPIALFAALKAGLVVVNVNPLYTELELERQLNDAQVHAVLVFDLFAHTVSSWSAKNPKVGVLVTSLSDMFPWLKGQCIRAYLYWVQKKRAHYHLPASVSWQAAMKEAKGHVFQPVDLSHQDLAFLQYTGGTTGVSKGAMLSHGNMLANLMQAVLWTHHVLREGSEVNCLALPIYHIFSLTANWLLFFYYGGNNIIVMNPRDIPDTVKQMSAYQFTVLIGVNTLFNALAHEPAIKTLDFSKLKLSLAAGVALQSDVAEKWQALTQRPIIEGYGLTEASPIVTINPLDLERYNGSIGQAVAGTALAILDDDHQALALGEVGELAIKGPQVMQGYWQHEAETKQVMTDAGWLLTGDCAVMDRQGFVYLKERKKDMINISGFNVYPNEVEDVLVRHEKVKEAAVVSIEDDAGDEQVKAVVVCEDQQSLNQDDVVAWCRASLTAYKVPKVVVFVDELPKSHVGKVLRRALRDTQAVT
jgi:long-chain acyl-CoA synthetase